MSRRSDQFWGDKCVIITGASSGIGAALVRQISSHGARLGLIARREQLLARSADQVRTAGTQAAWATANVTNSAQVRGAIDDLQASLGPCDTLIASAGIYHQTSARQFDATQANEVVATNVQGVINAIGAVLPDMVTRGRGHLVAISSIAGLLGLPTAGAYSASKAALVMLMRSLRLDLRSTGIQVTTICPGFVDTPMVTDKERATVRGMLSAEDAARRITRAIERKRAELWFPWRTWLPARLASLLSAGAYQRLASLLPEMEETEAAGPAAESHPGETSGGQPQPHNTQENQKNAGDADRAG